MSDRQDHPIYEQLAWFEAVQRTMNTPSFESAIDPALLDSLYSACEWGSESTIGELLLQPAMIEAALAPQDASVMVEKDSVRNLDFMVLIAARNARALTLDSLLNFAQAHGLPKESFVDRRTVLGAIGSGNSHAVDILISNKPAFTKLAISDTGCVLCAALATSVIDPPYNNNNLRTVQTLLRHGASPDKLIGCRQTHLRYAVDNASLSVVETLLTYGAQVQGSGAIHFAAAESRIDVLEVLYRYGGDLNERLGQNIEGLGRLYNVDDEVLVSQTPLHMAVGMKQYAAVAWLLTFGADPATEDSRGWNARDIAGTGADDNNERMLALFREFGFKK